MDRGTEWPQISTSLEDHRTFDKRVADKDPLLQTKAGKVFRSIDSKQLDPEIRRGLVRMKLESSKKAGTQSNQRAAAATAWLLANARNNLQAVTTAWAGQGSVRLVLVACSAVLRSQRASLGLDVGSSVLLVITAVPGFFRSLVTSILQQGVFLSKGGVFVATQNDVAVLSLGFRNYGAMGVELKMERSRAQPDRATGLV